VILAEAALETERFDKHIMSLINNVSMDQMFRRSRNKQLKQYDYLRSFLKDDRVSITIQSEIANMIAGKFYRSGNLDSTLHYQKIAIELSDIEDNDQKLINLLIEKVEQLENKE